MKKCPDDCQKPEGEKFATTEEVAKSLKGLFGKEHPILGAVTSLASALRPTPAKEERCEKDGKKFKSDRDSDFDPAKHCNGHPTPEPRKGECECHMYMKDNDGNITFPDCPVHGKGGSSPAYSNPTPEPGRECQRCEGECDGGMQDYIDARVEEAFARGLAAGRAEKDALRIAVFKAFKKERPDIKERVLSDFDAKRKDQESNSSTR